MTNLIYSQRKPNEQKICFQLIARVSFCFDSDFSYFKKKIDFLVEVLLNFWRSFATVLMNKSALVFVISIKWTYLELPVDN